MKRIRTLVVDDSPTVRGRLVDLLATDPQIEVVGEAGDGRRAIELCEVLRPDVITLDMMLPIMTGVTVTEYVMAHFPTPILIVSASINRGELYRTFDALAAGAVDVLDKPVNDEPDGEWESRFLAAVKRVSRIKVIRHPRLRIRNFGQSPNPTLAPAIGDRSKAGACQVVAIGASTGGPGAVVQILRALPDDFSVPVLLVLHIGEPFGASFADWLDGQTRHRVAFAKDGEALGCGSRVLMAPPERHLIVNGGKLHLTNGSERHSCRPSVDVLFESIATAFGPSAVACLLTGMGRDGAAGLLDIRRAGGVTIAQDEATSVVYGMPREAAMIGAAQHILPLHEIGPRLASFVAPHVRR